MLNPTIALIPDIHCDFPIEATNEALWLAEAQWIVDNQSAKNIVAVIGIGDNYSFFTTGPLAAKSGWDLIEAAGIPYIMTIGNHDYEDGNPVARSATTYLAYFGVSRFGSHADYATYPPAPENCYRKFTIAGITYLILALEFQPRDAVLAWGQTIIDANPTLPVIVATHAFLLHTGAYFPLFDGLTGNDGQSMWDSFVKKNKNIVAVFCGHDNPASPNSCTRTDTADSGNRITQTFFNYQSVASNAGKDTIALLDINPSGGNITTTAYSPFLGTYDSTGIYTLPLNILQKISNQLVYQPQMPVTSGATKMRDTSGRKHLVRG